MARIRYEPPRVDVIDEREGFPLPPARGPVTPWTLGTAANDGPDRTAEIHGETEGIYEEARAAGHAEGLATGLEEGRAMAQVELTAELARVQAGIDDLLGLHGRIVEQYRTQLASLAVDIAEAVLQRELADPGATVSHFVARAVAALGGDETCVITLSPATAEHLSAGLREHWPTATVRADASLGPGDVRVRNAAGSLEANVEARLAEARRLVLGLPEDDAS